jgi:hypothetical protein
VDELLRACIAEPLDQLRRLLDVGDEDDLRELRVRASLRRAGSGRRREREAALEGIGGRSGAPLDPELREELLALSTDGRFAEQ